MKKNVDWLRHMVDGDLRGREGIKPVLIHTLYKLIDLVEVADANYYCSCDGATCDHCKKDRMMAELDQMRLHYWKKRDTL